MRQTALVLSYSPANCNYKLQHRDKSEAGMRGRGRAMVASICAGLCVSQAQSKL